jgi:hypothetical protein
MRDLPKVTHERRPFDLAGHFAVSLRASCGKQVAAVEGAPARDTIQLVPLQRFLQNDSISYLFRYEGVSSG